METGLGLVLVGLLALAGVLGLRGRARAAWWLFATALMICVTIGLGILVGFAVETFT